MQELKFYGIRDGNDYNTMMRVSLYENACKTRNIKYVDVDASNFDYSSIPILTKNDFLFKIGRGGFRIESLLLNDEVITFYKRNPKTWFLRCTSEFDIIYEKERINKPKTIHYTSPNKTLLKKYVEYLNGFPLIIKVAGGSFGMGVIKVDSWENLISTIEFLYAEKKEIILKQFIKSDYAIRLLVIGDKVVHSVKSLNQKGDFRSNSGPLICEDITPSVEIINTAIKSVHLAGVELGGVDIIVDEKGSHYLLEMNFPCSIISQTIAGFDAAGAMVDYLIEKRSKYIEKIG